MSAAPVPFPLQPSELELVALRILFDTRGRRRAAAAFLAVNGVTQADVARHLGVDGSRVAQILSGDRALPTTVRRLEELGFPAFLLPAPRPGFMAA